MTPSLNTRLDIKITKIPKLGAKAALKAIKYWGQHKSSITHLVFHSTLGTIMPGLDYQLINFLGLDSSVKRFMLYHLGFYGGGIVLRLANDLAENNNGARVLVVCFEVMVNAFRGPSHAHLDILVGYAIFGDGAAAAIVGANPNILIECSFFKIISVNQTILPESDDAMGGRLREVGLIYYLSKKLSSKVANNIEKCLVDAFSPLEISDWNSLFWVVHPGGRKILDEIEAILELNEEKLKMSKKVLSKYGNMWSSSMIFVLDEMRKSLVGKGSTTTGEGFEYGVLLGFGPGVTVETIVLYS
ncbi:unnamed protein product [Camellia sinensis]